MATEQFQNFVVLRCLTAGEQHVTEGLPIQDAIKLDVSKEGILMVQSDGVSTCQHSEIGAGLICTFAMNNIKSHLNGWGPQLSRALKGTSETISRSVVDGFLTSLRSGILGQMRSVSWMLVPKDEGNVKAAMSYLQATLSFCIITPVFTLMAHIGDGFFVINGKEIVPDAGGMPDNLATALVPRANLKREPNNNFNLLHFGRTEELTEAMVASDGALKFNKMSQAKLEFNDDEPQGDIYQFRDSQYLDNPVMVQRRMNVITVRNRMFPGDDFSFLWAIRRS